MFHLELEAAKFCAAVELTVWAFALNSKNFVAN
jgi:hypothetical protein